MRSRNEVEAVLTHLKSGTCDKHATPENDTWIAVLEWVQGDPEHRRAFANFWDSLYQIAVESSNPEVLRRALYAALWRLEPSQPAAARLAAHISSQHPNDTPQSS